jgi:Fe2+ or Zn2+ uptake regulation protein
VNKRDEEISEQILKYLQRNPDSGDTLEGIAKFWLGFERIDQSVDEVRNALENLVKKGLIKKLEARDGKPIYKKAQETTN